MDTKERAKAMYQKAWDMTALWAREYSESKGREFGDKEAKDLWDIMMNPHTGGITGMILPACRGENVPSAKKWVGEIMESLWREDELTKKLWESVKKTESQNK